MAALSIADYLSIIHNGLPRTNRPRTVLIVGAGMAGLAAADRPAARGP
jgi:NADPH-dependent 2,4-dienoyl-CoA reductase/sulfur reductase-like enzyme